MRQTLEKVARRLKMDARALKPKNAPAVHAGAIASALRRCFRTPVSVQRDCQGQTAIPTSTTVPASHAAMRLLAKMPAVHIPARALLVLKVQIVKPTPTSASPPHAAMVQPTVWIALMTMCANALPAGRARTA